MVNEQIVLDFYLGLVEKDEIEFLQNRAELKEKTVAPIMDLSQSESIHHKTEVAKVLWKPLFEGAMSHKKKTNMAI
jgi:cobyrinic acid a,c-diamide synthase